MTRKNTFNSIYKLGTWNDNRADIPLSGPGSSLSATQAFREYFDNFCIGNDIKSIVDIGCGDLTWLPTTTAFSRCAYTGIDIADQLIANHTRLFPQHTFLNIDVITDEIPGGDLAIIRDVLFHMTHDEIATLLTKVKDKFKFYFITSCNQPANDSSMNLYNFHAVNLFKAPFNFKFHTHSIAEPQFDRSVYLFSAKQLSQNIALTTGGSEVTPDFESYDSLIRSEQFKASLHELNSALATALTNSHHEKLLIGNLFYDHLQPNFSTGPLLEACDQKRRRLFQAARQSSVMFEIGINGGHSALLCLMANPNLKIIANDIAQFYAPEPLCHPEVYVPVACETLKRLFPGRIVTIIGDCLTAVPEYVRSNPSKHVDLVHIDGEKTTYRADFDNLLPILRDGAIVVFDDSQQERVREVVDTLVAQGWCSRMPSFPCIRDKSTFTHDIVQLASRSTRLVRSFLHAIKTGLGISSIQQATNQQRSPQA
jgi:hypothetical protein